MSRKGESITLSLNISQQQELENIAFKLGLTWGKDKGNISKLMRAIAEGELIVCSIDKPDAVIADKEKKQINKAISILEKIVKS